MESLNVKLETRCKMLEKALSDQSTKIISVENGLNKEKENFNVIKGQLIECQLFLNELNANKKVEEGEIKNEEDNS